MMVPEWWLVLSGVFFGMFIILTLALVWLIVVIALQMREVGAQVRRLADRTEQISFRVEELIETVNKVSERIGEQAHGVASSANIVSKGLAQRTDVIATAFMAFNAIRRLILSRRR